MPDAEGPPPREGLAGRLLRWLPAVAVLGCAAIVLSRYGVSVRDMAKFGAYIAFGITLPGLLWVRVMYRNPLTLTEAVALGATLGYAMEVLTYIPARALGAPLLVLAWPLGTYALFIAVPRLRARWKGGPAARRAPLWWSWCLALTVIYLIVWTAVNFFRTQALTWPAIGASFVDMPFHLALVGELKHHMPPMVPTVAGEPLVYHWFVYAHMAATSWVTEVEPLVLLFRLAVLPMLAALVVLLALIGRRVTGSRAGALGAIAATVLVTAPTLYLGTTPGVFTWKTVQSWSSPTQTFGALLFAPIVLLLIDLFENRQRSRYSWVLLGIMMVAVMGAKATYLPLLTAGLAVVVVVEAVKWFWIPKQALVALGMSGACLLFAQYVFFGGVRQGITAEPLSIMKVSLANLTGGSAEQVSATAALGVTLLCVLCAAITWCGVLGLLHRPRLLARPAIVLVLGMSVAGLGVALLLGHPHLSQGYFLQAPYPYVAMVAVYGLAVVVRRARLRLWEVAVAAVTGMAAVYAIRMAFAVRVPLEPGHDQLELYLPYLALLGVALGAVVALRAARQGRLRTVALVMCVVTAAGTPAAWATRVLPGTYRSPMSGPPNPNGTPTEEMIPKGAFAAGRWLRANSDPGDLVATNTHCRWGYENPCDSRVFWTAALTERRVLVEGWAYTATNMDSWSSGEVVENRPFWDRDRIQANDAVFQAPSMESVRLLREGYGVRWLLVDHRRLAPRANLWAHAKQRFRSGDYGVYELAGDGGPVTRPGG
ncbi:hypothetical protein [Nonomuraea lactucae]|uniref:hypothetical protein n=1 Tax=Nonomuraea lactucae TaxID=2249762 RepID=UPI000DE294B9|nr:hypothetical protein [Nonomuraea lactucae]